MSLRAQTDCRFFSGYKPCALNDVCSSQCPSKQRAHPRILIVHLEALGAVLRATVLLKPIKRKWPFAHVTWLTSPAASLLLENNPLIDRVLKNDHSGILALSTLSFDFSYCLDKSLTAAGILKIPSEAGQAFGFGVEPETGAIIPLNSEAQELYDLGLSNHKKFFVNQKAETRLLTEAMGFDHKRDEYVFEFTKEELKQAQEFKERLHPNGSLRPVIGLNTGCSSVIPYKKLSVAGWGRIIEALSASVPEAQIILLGGPEDAVRNRQIAGNAKIPLVETPTDLGLRMGLVSMSACDVVVTGDSLGMHMAIALKKWVVAWFGPTCAHEIDLYDRGVKVLARVTCSPCWKRHCEKEKMCYDQVSIQAVCDGVDRGLCAIRDRERNLAAAAKINSPRDAQL